MNKIERTPGHGAPEGDMETEDAFSTCSERLVSNPFLLSLFVHLFYLLLKQSYRHWCFADNLCE